MSPPDKGLGLSLDKAISSPSMDARSMNIDEAREVYRKYGTSLNSDFEALSRIFRELNIEAPLENSNFLHALSLTDLMFRHTHRSLEMVTGGFGDGFIQCLRSSFVAMLDRIRRSGGKAQIIVINGDAAMLRQWSDTTYRGVLDIKVAKTKENFAHFIVGDDDMVRDEETHGRLDSTTDANLVRAKVYFKSHSMARVFSARFSAMWDALIAG